ALDSIARSGKHTVRLTPNERAMAMDEQLMLDPVRRRSWLFAKALETAPLSEALAFAEAAEVFITGAMEQGLAVTSAATFELPPKIKKQKKMLNGATQSEHPLAMPDELSGLSSLVSIDDVVLSLRQRGEVVLDGSEGADELLARANLKRAEQGLPSFALLPASPSETVQRDKGNQAKEVTAARSAAVPRPLNARERNELARQLVASAAE